MLNLLVLMSCFSAHAGAWECKAQVANPVFVSARERYTALPAADKARLSEKWNLLDREQKELWRMAGEADDACRRGELYEGGAEYYTRVLAWQDKLKEFLELAQPTSGASTEKGKAPARQEMAPVGGGDRPTNGPNALH